MLSIKVLAVTLLVASAAVNVSASGLNFNFFDFGSAIRATIASFVDSLASLHSGVTTAASISSSKDLSGCVCGDKICINDNKITCKVTPIATKGNCSEVPFGRNFTECIEKCYEGDVIVPVPRPTIELPRAVRGSVFSSGHRRLMTPLPLGGLINFDNSTASSDANSSATAGAAGNGTSVKPRSKTCRDDCRPNFIPADICKEMPNVKYDCKEEVVATQCSTKCKCKDNVEIELNE